MLLLEFKLLLLPLVCLELLLLLLLPLLNGFLVALEGVETVGSVLSFLIIGEDDELAATGVETDEDDDFLATEGLLLLLVLW